jgi:hypothetical protein
MGPDQFPTPQINCSYACGARDCDCLLDASRNLMFQQQIHQRMNALYK